MQNTGTQYMDRCQSMTSIHDPSTGERLNPKYVIKTFKSAQVKVMVWACFTGERLGPLIVCDKEGIGADEYEDIIYDGLFSRIDDLLEPPDDPGSIRVADQNTLLFMQDNALCHKATSILEFLQENHVPIMEWLPQSPDLNPIENLWTDLKHAFTNGFWSYSGIPQRVWKPDIDIARYYRKCGTARGWS